MCIAIGHVRFTPNSDRESGLPANGHVRFTPESGHSLLRLQVCLSVDLQRYIRVKNFVLRCSTGFKHTAAFLGTALAAPAFSDQRAIAQLV
jgi:hypothetical protein